MKIKHYIVFSLLVFTIKLFSQTEYNIDSIINIIKISSNDTNKLKLLSIVAENAEANVWPRYNNEMGKLAAILSSNKNKTISLVAKKFLAASYNNKGFYFSEQGAIQSSIFYYNRSLEIQKQIGDKEGEALTLNNLGSIYDSKGVFDKSLEYYFASLKIREKLNDKNALAQIYNNIAILYSNQYNFSKSLYYHQKSLNIRVQLNDFKKMALNYCNIGTTYSSIIEDKFLKKQTVDDSLLSKCLHYFYTAKAISQKHQDDEHITLSNFNIAELQILKAKYYCNGNDNKRDSLLKLTIVTYNNCLDYYTKINDKEWIANSYNRLASVYWILKDFSNCKINAEKALSLAKEIGYPSIYENAADYLRKVYTQSKNYERALEFTNLYYKMRDSVINKSNENELLSRYYIYEGEKLELQNKSEKEKLELTFNAKTKQQNIILFFTISVVLLLAVFGVIIYKRFKHSQNQTSIIQKQKEVVEEHQQEIIDSIKYAQKIQKALLPSDNYINKALNNKQK